MAPPKEGETERGGVGGTGGNGKVVETEKVRALQVGPPLCTFTPYFYAWHADQHFLQEKVGKLQKEQVGLSEGKGGCFCSLFRSLAFLMCRRSKRPRPLRRKNETSQRLPRRTFPAWKCKLDPTSHNTYTYGTS